MQHLTDAVAKVGEAHKRLHHHHRETVKAHHPHHAPPERTAPVPAPAGSTVTR